MNEADYSEKQLTLFEICNETQTESTQSGSCGKMSQEHLAQIKGMTLELCWKKSQKPTFQCLILDDGAKVGWLEAQNAMWHGGCSIVNTGAAPQRRARIFLVAGLGADSRPEVLFEPESLSRNTEKSQDKRKSATRDTAQSTDTTSWAFEPGITSRDGRKLTQDKTPTLRANMGDNQTAVVYSIGSYESNAMKSQNPNSGIYKAETSRTLDINCGNPACNQGGMAVVSMGHDERSAGFVPNIADPLTASDYKQPPVVACIGNGQCNQLSLQDKMGALNCMHDQQAVLIGSKAADDKNTCKLANGKTTTGTLLANCGTKLANRQPRGFQRRFLYN